MKANALRFPGHTADPSIICPFRLHVATIIPHFMFCLSLKISHAHNRFILICSCGRRASCCRTTTVIRSIINAAVPLQHLQCLDLSLMSAMDRKKKSSNACGCGGVVVALEYGCECTFGSGLLGFPCLSSISYIKLHDNDDREMLSAVDCGRSNTFSLDPDCCHVNNECRQKHRSCRTLRLTLSQVTLLSEGRRIT